MGTQNGKYLGMRRVALQYLRTFQVMITAEHLSFRLNVKPDWESWNVEKKSD